MTDLDEEAKRLAAAHPWASTGATETHRTDWQPQHAVPRRPAPYRPTDATIEARVAADLAAIDRELDPQAKPDVWGMWLDEVHPIDVHLMKKLQRHFAKTRHLSGLHSTDARGDVIYTPAPPKQRKPKTYVAPGRKLGRTWVARLEQSKQARKPK